MTVFDMKSRFIVVFLANFYLMVGICQIKLDKSLSPIKLIQKLAD